VLSNLAIAEQTMVSMDKLTLGTTIQKDLGMDGDDAEEIMVEFSKRFDVDMKDFDFMRFFYPEHLCLSFSPIAIWQWRHGRFPYYTEPISISDLINAAKAKKWLKVKQEGMIGRRDQTG
jgi:acyl carrier protein